MSDGEQETTSKDFKPKFPDARDKRGHKNQRHPLAKVHHSAQNGGHWWTYFEGADPPDWYSESEVYRRDEIPREHRPNPPRSPDWSKYVAYNCRVRTCHDNCLNCADSPYAQTKLCRVCYTQTDDFDDLRPLSKHLPQWARGFEFDHPTATSEGKGASARPEAQPERSSSRQPAQRIEQAAPPNSTGERSGERRSASRGPRSPERQAGPSGGRVSRSCEHGDRNEATTGNGVTGASDSQSVR
jgi:hypothetical protein